MANILKQNKKFQLLKLKSKMPRRFISPHLTRPTSDYQNELPSWEALSTYHQISAGGVNASNWQEIVAERQQPTRHLIGGDKYLAVIDTLKNIHSDVTP